MNEPKKVLPFALKPVLEDAIDFLRHWEPDGPWSLTAVKPDTAPPKIETRTFKPDMADVAMLWIDTHQGQGRNIYYSVNRLKRSAFRKKATKKEIDEIVALHVDIDLAGARNEEEEQAILRRLRQHPSPATAIIFSGGGFQAVWRLNDVLKAAEDRNIERTEALNKRRIKELGGDECCFNVDRILRLPGTINFPNAKKRAKGRVPALAHLVEANWDRRITPALPAIEKISEAKGEPETETGPTTEPPFENLPADLRKIIETGETKNSGGDRSRAVYAVACELVRKGWTDDSIQDVLLDPALGISAHVRAQHKPKRYARRQVARARDTTADDYRRNGKKIVANDQSNIRRALANLNVTVSHDTFADRMLIDGPDGEPRRFLGDPEISELWLMVDQRCGFRPTKDFFFDVVIDEARGNAFHPIRNYLDALQWDGKPRLDRWLVEYAGAEDTEYVRAVSRLVLVAAVRRARDPGCKFDEMMVLESKQGTDKSSALEVLAVNADWFSDSLPLNADDKKVIETLAGRWIVEAAELKGMRKGDIEHLKAFLSRRIDRARMSYGRLVTEVPRQCVIIGTTNSERYLRDSTGNRRFWPVRVKRFDLEALRRDRDQIWAEAARAEATGESIRLDPKLYSAAGEEQEGRRIEDPWVGMIDAALGDRNGKVTVEDVWVIVNVPEGVRTQEHNARLGDAMRELGWEHTRRRVGGERSYVYARGSETERLLWIRVTRDLDTRWLDVELVTAEKQKDIEEVAAEEARQRKIPF